MNEKNENVTSSFISKVKENKQYVALAVAVVALLAAILISILALKVAVVPVCVIFMLAIGIACCLDNEPIWLHGVMVLALVIAGILCKEIIFMLLGAVIYVIAILVLKYIKEL